MHTQEQHQCAPQTESMFNGGHHNVTRGTKELRHITLHIGLYVSVEFKLVGCYHGLSSVALIPVRSTSRGSRDGKSFPSKTSSYYWMTEKIKRGTPRIPARMGSEAARTREEPPRNPSRSNPAGEVAAPGTAAPSPAVPGTREIARLPRTRPEPCFASGWASFFPFGRLRSRSRCWRSQWAACTSAGSRAPVMAERRWSPPRLKLWSPGFLTATASFEDLAVMPWRTPMPNWTGTCRHRCRP